MNSCARSRSIAIAVLGVLLPAGLTVRTWAAQPPAQQTKKLPMTRADVRWEPDIRRFEDQDRKKPPAQGGIVFVGSSTIRRWDLAKSFPGLPAVNRGFGGSHMTDSLRYVDRIVTPYHPRVVVVYAGDNDLASGKSPQRVADEFKQFVAKVHTALPETKIVYIGIKPSISRWRLLDKIRAANVAVRQLAAGEPHLAFVDVEKAMLAPGGGPRPELFETDGLHLSAEGYRVWAALLRPHLTEGAGAKNGPPAK